jgi:two-component system chemotaxis family response regulator WspR
MVLLLPDTDDGGAREVGERVLRQVAELAIPHDVSKTSLIVTVSVGAATLVPDRRKAQERLIELADAGLYEAKKRGRNRVATA